MQGAEYPIRWKKGVYPVLRGRCQNLALLDGASGTIRKAGTGPAFRDICDELFMRAFSLRR